MRLLPGEAPQLCQCRLVFRVLQFLAVAGGEAVIALLRVGVVPAAQLCRGGEVFQPDNLCHQFFVDTARVEAVKEDGGFSGLWLVVIDAGDAKGHGFAPWMDLQKNPPCGGFLWRVAFSCFG